MDTLLFPHFQCFHDSPYVRTNSLNRIVSDLLCPLFWRFTSYACLIIQIWLLLFLLVFLKMEFSNSPYTHFRALPGTHLKVHIELQIQAAIKITLWGHRLFMEICILQIVQSQSFRNTFINQNCIGKLTLHCSKLFNANYQDILDTFNISKKYLGKRKVIAFHPA